MSHQEKTEPPAAKMAHGCLIVPGCFGGFILLLVLLSAASYLYSISSSLLAGAPWPKFPMEQTPRGWFQSFAFILSFIAIRVIWRKDRGKLAYWTVIACGFCWFILAVTCAPTTGSLQVGSWQITDPILAGRIFGGSVTGIALLLYIFDRKNRRWHGL